MARSRERSRARKHAQMRESFYAAPQNLQPCDVCGGQFVWEKLPENVYLGKRYCGLCMSRLPVKQIIRYIILVERLAKKHCMRHDLDWDDNEEIVEREDCKCLTCTAKRVLSNGKGKSNRAKEWWGKQSEVRSALARE